jgi:hypothetical protein
MMSKIVKAIPLLSFLLTSSLVHPEAVTDYEKQYCVQYEKPVTLTGTVLVRKIDYGKNPSDAPPEGKVPFPLLVLDQPICTWGGPDDQSEYLQWTLHIADLCSRAWPTVSRVRVSGTLFHADNWHHHSQVLILVKQMVGLDAELPACAEGSMR